MTGQVVARWESSSGAYWVEVLATEHGFSYRAPTGTGFLGAVEQDEAIAMIDERMSAGGVFQPDTQKRLLTRVDLTEQKAGIE